MEKICQSSFQCLESKFSSFLAVQNEVYLMQLKMRSLHMSCHTRKPTICICENKEADQLCSNCTADQHLCFRYMDSTTPLLLKSEISSSYPSSLAAQAGLYETWSETLKTRFLTSRLKLRIEALKCILHNLYQT